MSRRLLDYDPFTGVTTYFHYDSGTDITTLESVQDITSQMEAMKALKNSPEYSKQGIKRDWWHVGHIPDIIILKWMQEKGVNVYKKEHLHAVWALLDHPDYSHLKATTGHHLMKEKYGKIYNFADNKGSKVHG